MGLFGRQPPPLFPGAPARRSGHRPQALPLMPLLAATLLLLAGVQIYNWLGQGGGGALNALVTRVFYGFSLHPAWMEDAPAVVATRAVAEARVQRLPIEAEIEIPVTPRPGDLVLGDPAGRTTVTLLTDPACGACRNTLATLMATAAQPRTRLVVSFWPQNPAHATGGLVMALAEAGHVQKPFWKALMAAKGDLTDTQLLDLLAQVGLDFEAQRALLANNPALGRAMSGTFGAARRLNLAPPVVAVNGRVIPIELLGALVGPSH